MYLEVCLKHRFLTSRAIIIYLSYIFKSLNFLIYLFIWLKFSAFLYTLLNLKSSWNAANRQNNATL